MVDTGRPDTEIENGSHQDRVSQSFVLFLSCAKTVGLGIFQPFAHKIAVGQYIMQISTTKNI